MRRFVPEDTGWPDLSADICAARESMKGKLADFYATSTDETK